MKSIIILLLFPLFTLGQYDNDLYLDKEKMLNDNLNEIISSISTTDSGDTNIYQLKKAYFNRGKIFSDELNLYDSALYYFNKALDAELLALDTNLYTKCLNGKASVFRMTQRLQKAIDTHHAAILLQKEAFDTVGLIESYFNIGVSYYGVEKNQALKYFQKAERLSIVSEWEYMLGNVYMGIGQYFSDNKNIDSSKHYLNKAIPILQTHNKNYDLCNLNLQLALIHSRNGEYTKALEYAQQSQVVANKYNYLQLLKNVHDVFTEIYYHKGECDGAIENLIAKHNIVDSIRNLKVQKNIEELTVQYDLKLKDERNKQLKADLIATNLKVKNERFLFIIVLLIVLLFFGLIYYMYTTKKRRLIVSDMKVKLSEATKKTLMSRLNNAQRMILEKNNLINRLKDDVNENIESGEKARRLLEKLHTQNEWSEFMVEFELLHTGFFSKLNQKAKEPLTKNDTRLSALIKLNLSNKEISDLLFVSEAAVKKGKNRLIKKIELKEGERLSSYMNML